MEDGIHIRPLRRNEWRRFRDLRLAALSMAPGASTSSFEKERGYSARRWQQTLGGQDHHAFGLFEGNELVGITAVLTHRGDPSGETALLGMSFILPAYRGKGLSSLRH